VPNRVEDSARRSVPRLPSAPAQLPEVFFLLATFAFMAGFPGAGYHTRLQHRGGHIHLAPRHMGPQQEIVPPAPSGLRQNDPLSSATSVGYPAVRRSIRSNTLPRDLHNTVGGLTVGSDCQVHVVAMVETMACPTCCPVTSPWSEI
jgi:hypothetical protein